MKLVTVILFVKLVTHSEKHKNGKEMEIEIGLQPTNIIANTLNLPDLLSKQSQRQLFTQYLRTKPIYNPIKKIRA